MGNLAEAAAHLGQLAVAFVLALPIAWDREHRERSAGLRTFTLVAISTCDEALRHADIAAPKEPEARRSWYALLSVLLNGRATSAAGRKFYETVFGWSFAPWGPPNFYRIETGTESGASAVACKNAANSGPARR